MEIAKKLDALIAWRTRTGTRQEDLARLAEVSGATMSRYENGLVPMPIEMSVKLALITNVPIVELVSDERATRLLKLLSDQANASVKSGGNNADVA